jgi:electron transfer flavoprotein alpha/beta subunit
MRQILSAKKRTIEELDTENMHETHMTVKGVSLPPRREVQMLEGDAQQAVAKLIAALRMDDSL